MLRRLAIAAIVALASIQAADAATRQFTVLNQAPADLTRLVLLGIDAPPLGILRSGQQRTITVVVPDGKCRVDVHAEFSDGGTYNKKFNFCIWNALRLY